MVQFKSRQRGVRNPRHLFRSSLNSRFKAAQILLGPSALGHQFLKTQLSHWSQAPNFADRLVIMPSQRPLRFYIEFGGPGSFGRFLLLNCPWATRGKEQMSYVESNLVPGETVIYKTRLHWIVMLWQVILGCLLFGLAGALLFYYALNRTAMQSKALHIMEGGGVALLVCGLVVILTGLVRRNATEMAVTNRRVVIKTGLASRKTIEMLLNKVESIEVSETAFGRMLGYGTIVVIGTGGTPEPFHKVAHPLEFRSQVQQQIEQLH
jgi:hypothetical protein